MANSFRYRRGAATPESFVVLDATVIEIGDMCMLDSGTLKPATSQVLVTDYAGTIAAFALKYVGVARSQSLAGDTSPVSVDTDAEFEFDSASATYVNGDPVAPADAGAGTLLNQTVEAAAVAASSIGTVTSGVTSGTKVLVQSNSRVRSPGSAI